MQHQFCNYPPCLRNVVMSISVCQSVRLSASISLETHIQTSPNCMLPYGRFLVIFWRRWDTSSTSGFIDDVTFPIMSFMTRLFDCKFVSDPINNDDDVDSLPRSWSSTFDQSIVTGPTIAQSTSPATRSSDVIVWVAVRALERLGLTH